MFEVPVHVQVVQLCHGTVLQSGETSRAWIHQAAVIVIPVRFKASYDDFIVCGVVAVLKRREVAIKDLIQFLYSYVCFFQHYLWLLEVALIQNWNVSWKGSLIHTVPLKKRVLQLECGKK